MGTDEIVSFWFTYSFDKYLLSACNFEELRRVTQDMPLWYADCFVLKATLAMVSGETFAPHP